MTWCQSNITLINQDVCLFMTSPNDNVTWSIDLHLCMKRVGSDRFVWGKSAASVNRLYNCLFICGTFICIQSLFVSILLYIISFLFYISPFSFPYFFFVFSKFSFLFCKRLFIFDVLHLYSITKTQLNLHNDLCASLVLMRVFATGAYRCGRHEGCGYNEWLWLGK